jgi:hypothetical protein
MNKRVFYIEVDDAEGMDAISLVKHPAVNVDFLCFDEEKKPVKLNFNEEKKVITGVVCLADTPIYRYSEGFGEYWVVFTKEAIEKMIIKYSKNNLFNSINLQHNNDKVVEGIYLFESYLINKDRGIYPNEFNDIPNGSWICSFKVENEEVWKEIKEGNELNGFSLQGYFDLVETKVTNELEDLIDEILN